MIAFAWNPDWTLSLPGAPAIPRLSLSGRKAVSDKLVSDGLHLIADRDEVIETEEKHDRLGLPVDGEPHADKRCAIIVDHGAELDRSVGGVFHLFRHFVIPSAAQDACFGEQPSRTQDAAQ